MTLTRADAARVPIDLMGRRCDKRKLTRVSACPSLTCAMRATPEGWRPRLRGLHSRARGAEQAPTLNPVLIGSPLRGFDPYSHFDST